MSLIIKRGGGIFVQEQGFMGLPTKPAEQTQLDRFKETARQIGCDEDEAAFDEKLRHIAKQKPKPTPDPK